MSPILYLLVLRGSLASAAFWYTFNLIGIARWMRSTTIIAPIVILTAFLIGLIITTRLDSEKRRFVLRCCDILSGFILATATIHAGIDRILTFGAIVALPFILGAVLAMATLLAWYNIDGPHLRAGRRPARTSSMQASAFILIALLLMQPGAGAMFGLSASPPDPAPGPWQETATDQGMVMNSFEVMETKPFHPFMADDAIESKWRVYVAYSTAFPTTTPRGVAIFMHAHTGQEIEIFYTELLEGLASQGLIVLAPQYVTEWNDALAPETEADAIRGGTSDPRHAVNIDFGVTHAREAFAALMSPDSELGRSVRADLGEQLVIDPTSLWIGGHSFGGGAAIHIAAEMTADGHGADALVIDVLVPFGISDAVGISPDLSHLPDHTIAHVIEHDADNIVNGCDGRWMAHRLSTRDNNTGTRISGVLHLLTRSDFHGFPRLLATHYLPVDMLHDALAELTIHDRISAQAAFVQGTASGTGELETIRAHLTDENGTLSDLGTWSDGTPVIPVLIEEDPVSSRDCAEIRPPS